MIEKQEDEVSKTLKDVGVDYYTHRNENLITENAVEGERMKVLLEVRQSNSIFLLRTVAHYDILTNS